MGGQLRLHTLNNLKKAMMTALIHARPNFSKISILEIHASGFGLEEVLLHDGHSIAYFNNVLGPSARLKSIYETELMAIVLAMQKWRHYTLGRIHCQIYWSKGKGVSELMGFDLKFTKSQGLHIQWLMQSLGSLLAE